MRLYSTSRFFSKPSFHTSAYFTHSSQSGIGARLFVRPFSFTTSLRQTTPEAIAMVNNKRPYHGGNNKGGGHRAQKKFRSKRKAALSEGSPEEVLAADIAALRLSFAAVNEQPVSDETAEGADDAAAEKDTAPAVSVPEQGTEIDVEVIELSSTGDALAKQVGSTSDHLYVVPFSVPGDVVRVKVYRHVLDEGYSQADFLSVVTPSPLRDDTRIGCKYFAKCSGCQFQMLDYSEQLKLKKNIVVKAYRNFSQLPPELVPGILDTIGSPLQYGYRTKLTPHFDGPPGANRKGFKKPLEERPPIGFTPKTSRRVLDIEDCPIATEAVRKGLTAERERMATEYSKYTKGATILLRENTKRVPTPVTTHPEGVPEDAVKVESEKYVDYKTYITDNNATSTEYIDDFVFTNPAGSFFQNNNSILSPFTEYIGQHVLPPPALASPSSKQIKYLIDAYSGSGLFTITQSSLFPGGSIGIDIADKSIAYARKNATLNNLKEEQCRFIAADAPELFKSVSNETMDPDETVVILDPPRKGCDASFLRQLLKFAPRRVVYVSCNVHTQARDVGILVRGEVDGSVLDPNKKTENGAEEKMENGGEGREKVRYEIESIRGFDFFPQTGHVEGVAVLNRVDM
ncbi:S-adenosyl-L-methionine-dependent methyltransferase [Diplogelasinospora grovesii]|uniref:tRNA (uracil(54)-C(5))-methyltransferase n=1 Tax=Diplogelasinospora grovesii TaxID=303347 RepID=A0AAN6S9W7_9PEZI|nr:S-adenosyl-L-methionine-dependent methyltransferase [Diplogelasinospora grovesii]